MSLAPEPKDNWDNIWDFFFGNKKNTKRTLIIIAAIIVLAKIDTLIALAQSLVVKVANMAIGLMPAIIIIGVFVFLIKKLSGKK